MKTIRLFLLLLVTTGAPLARSEVVTFWFNGRIENISNEEIQLRFTDMYSA